MSWSLANFRDLDYHWITPTMFGSNSQMQLVVADCSGTCTPDDYVGRLVADDLADPLRVTPSRGVPAGET